MMRIQSMITAILIFVLAFGSLPLTPVYAQYSQAQINHAISELEKWNMLDYMVDKTEQDSKQLATRADILIACYEIVKELKDLESAQSMQETALQNIRTRMQNLTVTGTQEPVNLNEEQLIDKVTNQVLNNINSLKDEDDEAEELAELKKEILTLRAGVLKNLEDNDKALKKARSDARNAKWAAIGSFILNFAIMFLVAGPDFND